MIIHFSLGASLFSHPLALRSQLLAEAVEGWAEAWEALQMQRCKHAATRLPDYASYNPEKWVCVLCSAALSQGSGRSQRPSSVKVAARWTAITARLKGLARGPDALQSPQSNGSAPHHQI